MNEIRFVMQSTMPPEGRIARMQDALALGARPLFERHERKDWLNIVGYGPSLRDTWSAIEGPTMTCSGAHDFLIERGKVPTWHAESDPWPAKALFTKNVHEDVTYLIASCCHPDVWQNVAGKSRYIWHCAEPETESWIKQNDPGGCITGFGTTIGERCLELGLILGFRRFRYFGIDCSFAQNGDQRAGEHRGGEHDVIEAEIAGFGTFQTSHAMIFSARTLVNELLRAQIECEVYGDGLMRAMLQATIKRREDAERGVFRRTGNVKSETRMAA